MDRREAMNLHALDDFVFGLFLPAQADDMDVKTVFEERFGFPFDIRRERVETVIDETQAFARIASLVFHRITAHPKGTSTYVTLSRQSHPTTSHPHKSRTGRRGSFDEPMR
jgi:hypothetical protein